MGKKARVTVSTTMLMMTTMAIIMITVFFGLLPCALAYTAADFINAYKDPAVAKIDVPNDLVLTESLPPISRPLSITGVGAKRPVVSGGKRLDGGAAVFSAGNQNTVINRCVFQGNVGGAISITGGWYEFTIAGSLSLATETHPALAEHSRRRWKEKGASRTPSSTTTTPRREAEPSMCVWDRRQSNGASSWAIESTALAAAGCPAPGPRASSPAPSSSTTWPKEGEEGCASSQMVRASPACAPATASQETGPSPIVGPLTCT
ncbi:hypothetical protein CBR_g45771 [Chara braunii]|uniref:Uncharacterized protein n=1 Tax=Chara braunii TaxID=69332 RepID=A0A388LZI3_CHABU|nr:hypothetical protein CBR_g45771 [Chara braunii]|eukprot:GBG87619.1 hypothetical protein CBR_g45771 [Chara braunii]